MKYRRLLAFSSLVTVLVSNSVFAASFDEYVDKLAQHPQVASIIAQSEATKELSLGVIGLPDPVFTLGVDNVPLSDPAFDRFLPTSKIIGFNQKIPNPYLLLAKAGTLEQLSEKQKLIADYTKDRLQFMLLTKLAEYKSVKTQSSLIKQQLGFYLELEDTFTGQIEAGRAVYQRFSEVDVERAEAERKLNNLQAQKSYVEAEFVRLVGEVPDIDVPETVSSLWDKGGSTLYPVLIAKQDIDIASKNVGVADAAFLPNFGVNAVYKQRQEGENNSFDGDDWFSLQAQITLPLWASDNQKPKLRAAKNKEQSAKFAYEDTRRQWISRMIALQSSRDAAAKNVKILRDKANAMKGKINAARRNYEAGVTELDTVLLAKIDRLNIKVQIAQVKATHISKIAEFNSNIVGGFKGVDE